AGCSINPLVTSRASYTFEWKGFASSVVAMASMQAVMLAKENLTGPLAIFEGPKGFKEIFGMELKHAWTNEDFGRIKKCILKIHNAEVHTQTIIEAALELKNAHNIEHNTIQKI